MEIEKPDIQAARRAVSLNRWQKAHNFYKSVVAEAPVGSATWEEASIGVLHSLANLKEREVPEGYEDVSSALLAETKVLIERENSGATVAAAHVYAAFATQMNCKSEDEFSKALPQVALHVRAVEEDCADCMPWNLWALSTRKSM